MRLPRERHLQIARLAEARNAKPRPPSEDSATASTRNCISTSSATAERLQQSASRDRLLRDISYEPRAPLARRSVAVARAQERNREGGGLLMRIGLPASG